MQPQVSGKVGSLVGWLVFGWTMFGIPDNCRILPKGQRPVVGAGTQMLLLKQLNESVRTSFA